MAVTTSRTFVPRCCKLRNQPSRPNAAVLPAFEFLGGAKDGIPGASSPGRCRGRCCGTAIAKESGPPGVICVMSPGLLGRLSTLEAGIDIVPQRAAFLTFGRRQFVQRVRIA